MRSAVLALMSVAVLTLVGCGTAKPHPPAPTTAALRLAPGLKVGRSVPGDSDIDSADGRHYRYMIVVGPHRASPVGILRSEVHVLQRAGWRRGTTTASAANGGSQVTGLSRRGAVTLLYRAKGSIYVALEYVSSMGDLEGATELNPGAPVGPLRRLLRRGFPMLSATLGHQND